MRKADTTNPGRYTVAVAARHDTAKDAAVTVIDEGTRTVAARVMLDRELPFETRHRIGHAIVEALRGKP